MFSPTLAIDFGTSNSAAAILHDGMVRRIPLENGHDTLPTAVFFPAHGGDMRIGSAAAEALVAGAEGRYMRALKSVLGTALLHEPRLIGGKRRSVADVIATYLTELRSRAEAMTGGRICRALSGRPVHFHSANPARDAQAEADLRACYLAAGFEEVAFLPEPEAAALASHGLGAPGALGLVVDIGGGTSDFSIFRSLGPGKRPEILANHGIRLGGTDFDHAVSMAHVMPHLGLGGALRREMGTGLLPVPQAIYVDLATWAKIPFLYAPEVRRQVAGMVKLAEDRRALERLATVLGEELGHDIAFAVERGKIAANGAAGVARIALGAVEPGLSAAVSAASLDACLGPARVALRTAMAETLAQSQVEFGQIAVLVLVGGASLMGFVADEAQALFPQASLRRAEAFTAVVDGLALASADIG